MGPVIGHEGVLRLLKQSLQKGRLAHSYLLVGPPHVGKMTVALYLAQAVNCTGSSQPCRACSQCVRIASGRHADVQVLGLREGGATKEISIDQVREIQRAASLKPFEGSCRVFIVEGAERLSAHATNALLKTLEEPPPQVLLLLLATDEEALLPTLRSRCQRLELYSLGVQEVARALEERGVAPKMAQHLALHSQGCPGIALRALEEPEWLEAQEVEAEQVAQLLTASLHQRFALAAELAQRFQANREDVQAVLGLWLEWWRDLLLVKEGATAYLVHPELRPTLEGLAPEVDALAVARSLRLIQETLDVLDQNANARMALEHLLLGFPFLERQETAAT
ncbi:MAG: DNA polymerase III subunit delta' [Dehalococcoidia bacterium]|nr:DNA polymerase III subunit delta' [Dehalococcoidia bacterium]